MDIKWEEFPGAPPVPPEQRMHVTLNRHCLLLLNGTVFQALGGPARVKLLFDRRLQIIGVKPADESDAKAFRLRPHPKGKHRLVSITGFCKYYGTVPPEPIRFTAPRIENGVLILSLHETEDTQKNPRKRER